MGTGTGLADYHTASTWPAAPGVVGGLSLVAARARPADHSGARARSALAAWECTTASTVDPGWVRRSGDFPYTEILPHYQTVGRLQVAPELVIELVDLRTRLRSEPSAGDPAWLLAGWLTSATDQRDGNYDSYLGVDLLERTIAVCGWGTEAARDGLLVTMVADLAEFEADALLVRPTSKKQQARMVAAAKILAQRARLAPAAGEGTGEPQFSPSDLPWDVQAQRSKEIAREALATLPDVFGQAVRISMMPITPLHDEYMFMRTVQIFELLYWNVVSRLQGAATALGQGDRARARAELIDAADRMEATPAIYRVLTGMPREVFTVIRGLTDGRSAIQSRPYRLVEMVSAPRELSAEIRQKIPPIELPGATLQEVFEQQAGRHGYPALRLVAEAMVRLDRAWRAAKRTHWGITRKIIGEVRGTGGTSGVHYLQEAAEVRLFPSLDETGGDR